MSSLKDKVRKKKRKDADEAAAAPDEDDKAEDDTRPAREYQQWFDAGLPDDDEGDCVGEVGQARPSTPLFPVDESGAPLPPTPPR